MAKKTVRKKEAAKEAKPSASVRKVKSAKASTQIKKASKPRTPPVKHTISIDHPSHGDKIAPHHYTVRISCSSAGLVEISINGDSWLACREAVGYRWFDWCPSGSGEHVLVARLLDDGGAVIGESASIVCEAE